MYSALLSIKTADGDCDSYVAYPQGNNQQHPLVIFYMDAIGLRPQIYSMVKRVAEQGYFVVAPNLFYRTKNVPIVDYETLLKPEKMPELFKQVLAMAAQLTPDQARQDMADLVQFAESQKQANTNHIGLVGYCMGGAVAIRNAAYFPDRVRAAASFHAGRLATDQPTSPHLLAKHIKAALYVAHADHDQSMTSDQIAVFEKAMSTGGVRLKSELYREAKHGFTMEDLPVYSESADARHWSSMFDLFASELNKNGRV